MRLKFIATGAILVSFLSNVAWARVVKLDVEHREVVLKGKSFGSAGPYEKLVGKVEFALDRYLPAGTVDPRELGVIVTSVGFEPRKSPISNP